MNPRPSHDTCLRIKLNALILEEPSAYFGSAGGGESFSAERHRKKRTRKIEDYGKLHQKQP